MSDIFAVLHRLTTQDRSFRSSLCLRSLLSCAGQRYESIDDGIGTVALLQLSTSCDWLFLGQVAERKAENKENGGGEDPGSQQGCRGGWGHRIYLFL